MIGVDSLLKIKDFLPYATKKKIKNFITSQYEYLMKRVKLVGLPYSYFIDPGNICNLKCALCPTANNHNQVIKSFMKFSTYRRILDKVKDYAFFVRLYNWGEPFLNKDILKIIKYTKKNNIGVIISSNFNIVTDKIIKYLIKLEVDKIIISLDGVDQKSYESYRRGGNFQLVIENVKKIIKKRNELNSRKPDIIWQYLINKKNEKFVSNAKSMAKSIGVKISFPKFQISQEIVKTGDVINYSLVNEWIPDRLTKNPANYLFVTKPPCYFLYRTMVINPDGTVMPCCAVYDPKYNFGNILEDSLEGVWNNSYFLSARSIFSNKNFDNKKTTICDSCLSTWGMKYIKNIKFENV